ncbi:MAG TPA: hypothetical protein DEB06_07420 [Phycisphaerales bacterium]|nr:hypothetical protein [Phycisphaerales bacterium]
MRTMRALALAIGAAVPPSAVVNAGVIRVNGPTEVFLPDSTVMSARYRLSNTNWDVMIANSAQVSVGTITQSSSVGNSASLNGVVWDFTLSHTPADGFALSMTRADTDTAVLVEYSMARRGSPAVDPTRSFNALSLSAIAGSSYDARRISSAYVEASSLSFNLAGGVQTGVFTVLRDDLDDSGAPSDGQDPDSYTQHLVSDADLSTLAWSLTGRLSAGFVLRPGQTSPGNIDERLKINFTAHSAVIPETGTPGALALLACGVLVRSGRQRSRAAASSEPLMA